MGWFAFFRLFEWFCHIKYWLATCWLFKNAYRVSINYSNAHLGLVRFWLDTFASDRHVLIERQTTADLDQKTDEPIWEEKYTTEEVERGWSTVAVTTNQDTQAFIAELNRAFRIRGLEKRAWSIREVCYAMTGFVVSIILHRIYVRFTFRIWNLLCWCVSGYDIVRELIWIYTEHIV